MNKLLTSAEHDVRVRDVEYTHDGTRMRGAVVAAPGTRGAPGVLLVHDAFGPGEDMLAIARRLAALGRPVFCADIWGARTRPRTMAEIGPLIGGMVADRARWIARVSAAHEAAGAQPELDGGCLVALGYCFGGSSALEYLRGGGRLAGVVGVHAGLDLLDPGADWSAAHPGASVLLCTGADDPMATAAQRDALQNALTGAGIDWETDVYGGTVHAFTSPRARNSPDPRVIAHHPRSAARAWDATTRFLRETLPA
ncbi:dienelactone hydrolase family protein [Myceligenerans salitolerans]|uniref:Dienelactone hydrolase family protein n=1 Tax=Myceligenerans salitolerans TaxID=1230528 RepID=A0ABS3IAT6_9MICO|nr:dienelactone hydrolase family protein [Myceligenerans salitolerans]MBO0610113.1 dienelactone hydrolase family protein [Myceligenerans salitolerans]